MEFYATCPSGLEHLLADELRACGAEGVRPLRGQVAFSGGAEAGYRACLASRIASRVVAVIARVDAASSDDLYRSLADIPWEEHLSPTTTLAIDATGTNAELRNTRFVELRAKDAVSDRMLERTGTRPATDARAAGLRLAVRVREERASVGVDLCGEPLFRRGYERRDSHSLRADYAAALLLAAGWSQMPAGMLVLPGGEAQTLAAEGVGIACGQAPGALRHRWGFEGWLGHDEAAWRRARAWAKAQERPREEPVLLLCSDVTRCLSAIRSAGLGQLAQVQQLDGSHPDVESPALLARDLSWVRDDDLARQASELSSLAQAVDALPQGSKAAVISRDDLPDAALRCAPTGVDEVRLGQGPAFVRCYELPEGRSPSPAIQLRDGRNTQVSVLVPASEQFASRLAKVARQRAKWARSQDVSCYRVYDSDLPDYAVAIDLYEVERRTPVRCAVIQEYAAPREVDPGLARRRLLDVLAIVPPLLGVEPRDVHLKVRTRSRGGSQYAEEGGRSRTDVILEGGLEFEVNLSGRIDTGIFLDNRETRSLLREMAKPGEGGRRSFLNLFAYTGTASCYAADGGAASTTTVDLSATYLDWARRNMGRNGFDGPEHEFVQADVLRWASEQRHGKRRWDLVFCEPPTFSNSARMRKRAFDVQRDHVQLLVDVSRLLAPGGVCVFSCNLRTFKPDEEALARAGVVLEDITKQTIPEDFARNPRIHRCFLVRRK